MGREGAHLLQMDRLREVRPLNKLEAGHHRLIKSPIAGRVRRHHPIGRTDFSSEGAVLSLLVPKKLLSTSHQNCTTTYVPQYQFPLTVPFFSCLSAVGYNC